MSTPRSFRSRMGNAVRRTSSILSITRPSTPSVHSDSGSIKHLDAPSQLVVPATIQPEAHHTPSPIMESPAREAAETPAAGPSPLAQAAVHDEPDDMHDTHSSEPAEVTKAVLEAHKVVEEAPAQVGEIAEAKGSEIALNAVAHDAEKVSVHTQVNMDEGHSIADNASILSPPPPPAAESLAGVTSYFEPQPNSSANVDFVTNLDDADEAMSSQTTPHPSVTTDAPQSFSTMPVPEGDVAKEEPTPAVVPMYADAAAPQNVWDAPSYRSTDDSSAMYPQHVSWNDNTVVHDQASVQMPLEDPFADPMPIAREVSHPMPEPQIGGPNAVPEDETPVVLMPLPQAHDAIADRSVRTTASVHSWVPHMQDQALETDERLPLLPKATLAPPGNGSYLVTPHSPGVNVSPNSPAPLWSVPLPSLPKLHDLGWLEYLLPDASFYYVHPTMRVTTDIDLRNAKKLGVVSRYLEHYKDGAPVGLELWLCEKNDRKNREIALVEWWVDHGKKRVSNERPSDDGMRIKNKATDDAMDMEYRYWSFMESHPAHESIPTQVRVEAMDVLTWAWTERLLPSQRSLPPPFSQDECQELMSLIRTFDDSHGNAGMQGVIQNRIIARILLRVVHWRQMNFRPNKALPKILSNTPPLPARRSPARKAIVDFFISCICLGIPYLFYNRSHLHRTDEESGIRTAGPMLIIGACTCLVAAIVLSASVTFLSLPGLDNFARVAGLIAVLFSAFSMASTVVALFKYKVDAERAVSVVGSEGFWMISRRHVVFSLPLVFLSYAVIGFIAGLVLYSFRGVTTNNAAVIGHRFEEYTSWVVVGVLGAALGVLMTSIMLMRR